MRSIFCLSFSLYCLYFMMTLTFVIYTISFSLKCESWCNSKICLPCFLKKESFFLSKKRELGQVEWNSFVKQPLYWCYVTYIKARSRLCCKYIGVYCSLFIILTIYTLSKYIYISIDMNTVHRKFTHLHGIRVLVT